MWWKSDKSNEVMAFWIFAMFIRHFNIQYTGCPKKAERRIFIPQSNKFHILDIIRTSSAEENDTRIIKSGWVIRNLCRLLEIQSFSYFALLFCDRWTKNCVGTCFHKVSWGNPLIRGNKTFQRNADQWASKKQRIYACYIWKAFPFTILRSSVAKINRNLKITVFQEMGIESTLLNQI